VDTFERLAAREQLFSCPLPSLVYALRYIAKSIAGESQAGRGVIRFALVLAHGLRHHGGGDEP
jgi:hypothetical protein